MEQIWFSGMCLCPGGNKFRYIHTDIGDGVCTRGSRADEVDIDCGDLLMRRVRGMEPVSDKDESVVDS